MILLQVTNPIFVLKDEFYSLTCCVVRQLKGVCKRRIMKIIIQMWDLTHTSSKSFEYFNYLQCFTIAGRDNVNLKCSLLPTLKENKLTLKTNVAISTHLAAKWTETRIYYFINSSHHSSSYLHNHTKTKFTINHFKYYSFNLNFNQEIN